jgi:hypothetical protein
MFCIINKNSVRSDECKVHMDGRGIGELQPSREEQRDGCPFGHGRNELQHAWRRKE